MQPPNQSTSLTSNPSTVTKSTSDVATVLDLYSVKDRLKTFDHWPVSFMRKEDVAEAGFYYTNCEDIVKCPHCKIEVGHWVEDDIPMNEHEKFSPNCRFLLNKRTAVHTEERLPNTPSIPLGEDTCGLCMSITSPSRSPFQRSQIKDIPPSLASSGEDTCGIHDVKNEKQSSALESQRISKETMMQKLRVNSTEIPVDDNHTNYCDRLKTYDKWPKESKLTPDWLSLAGFVYTGENDRVSCFHCGGTLQNWAIFDDPWIEHAHWFPNCKYVLASKGQKFIDRARLQKNEDLLRAEEEIQNAIETCKELVSAANSNTSDNRKCKVNESSSKGISDISCGMAIAKDRMTCFCCLQNERNAILLP